MHFENEEGVLISFPSHKCGNYDLMVVWISVNDELQDIFSLIPKRLKEKKVIIVADPDLSLYRINTKCEQTLKSFGVTNNIFDTVLVGIEDGCFQVMKHYAPIKYKQVGLINPVYDDKNKDRNYGQNVILSIHRDLDDKLENLISKIKDSGGKIDHRKLKREQHIAYYFEKHVK